MTEKNSDKKFLQEQLDGDKKQIIFLQEQLDRAFTNGHFWEETAKRAQQSSNYYQKELERAHTLLGRVIHQTSERWDSVNLTRYFPTDNLAGKRTLQDPTGGK